MTIFPLVPCFCFECLVSVLLGTLVFESLVCFLVVRFTSVFSIFLQAYFHCCVPAFPSDSGIQFFSFFSLARRGFSRLIIDPFCFRIWYDYDN